MQRVAQLVGITSSSQEIDLTKTTFNPDNPEHIATINKHIKSFNEVQLGLFKKDVIMVAPISFFVSLFVTGIFGYIAESAALSVCIALIWASDFWHKRVIQNAECQVELTCLLSIYKRCIADHGYQITGNSCVLDLLKTIAPYVSTRSLWEVSGKNPAYYPESFKQILSSPPHRVPFENGRQAESSVLSALRVNVAEVSVSQLSDLGVVTLFKKVTADTRQTVYGLDDSRIQAPLNNRR